MALPNPHILALDIVLAIAIAAPLDDNDQQLCILDRLLDLRLAAEAKELGPGTSIAMAVEPALSASARTTAELKQSEVRALGGDLAHGCWQRSITERCPVDRAKTRLMEYWAHGEGAAKIQWGIPGDFDRCVVELGKHVSPSIVKGLCSNLHQRATGARPGHAGSEQDGHHKGH